MSTEARGESARAREEYWPKAGEGNAEQRKRSEGRAASQRTRAACTPVAVAIGKDAQSG